MPVYDIFISYAHADSARVRELFDALSAAHLKVWLDEPEIPTFGALAQRVADAIASSRVFIAYYSKIYPTRRACQYEMTAAFVAALGHASPSERILVVNPESSDAHIYPIGLRNTKYLAAPTTPQELVAAAAAVTSHLAALGSLEPLGTTARLQPPQWFPGRATGSNGFVGRIDKMWELHSRLHQSQAPFAAKGVTGEVAQITGLGGTGKSLLAEEYALRFGAAYPAGVFWLRAYGDQEAGAAVNVAHLDAVRRNQVATLARQLGLPFNGTDSDVVLRQYFEERGQPGLWVIDDFPANASVGALRSWFAPHPLLKTLITTRSREYQNAVSTVDLGVLPDDDAYMLLTSRVPVRTAAEKSAAQSAIAALGALALALDVAGAALANYEGATPYQTFFRELENPNEDSLELASALADALPNGHEKSIAATLLGSIRASSEAARDVLRLASLFAAAPIPELLLLLIPDETNGRPVMERAAAAFRIASRDLLRFSLAEKREGAEWLIHPLIARALHYAYGKDSRTGVLRSAATATLHAWLLDRRSQGLPAGGELAHARKLATSSDAAAETNLLQLVANHDEGSGAYAAAEAEFREVLRRCQTRGEPELTLLAVENNLAVCLRASGDLKQAREIQTRVLTRKQQLLGPNHRETITSLDNLAVTVGAQSDFGEAAAMHAVAVTQFSTQFGEKDPDTLVAMASLASALRDANRLDEALECGKKVLALRTEVLGPDHPATLRSLEGVAVTVSKMGRPKEALPALEHAAREASRRLGDDHPMTLSIRDNLARARVEADDLVSGHSLGLAVLEGRRRVLGKTHPDTLKTSAWLGQSLMRSGAVLQARTLSVEVRQALDALTSSVGPRDARTTTCAWSLYATIADDSESRASAVKLVDEYLAWLLTAADSTLEASQRTVRDQFARTSDGEFRMLVAHVRASTT